LRLTLRRRPRRWRSEQQLPPARSGGRGLPRRPRLGATRSATSTLASQEACAGAVTPESWARASSVGHRGPFDGQAAGHRTTLGLVRL